MNRLTYNQTGGFPLSTNILDAAQTAYTIFNALGFLAGNYAIISGCEVVGNTVNNGVVFINGEILEFRGGNILEHVIILEDIEKRFFEDGLEKVVIHKRYACFGYSVENHPWALFQKIYPTTLIQNFKDNFEQRITALENKPSAIAIGTIVRYDQPLVVLPPVGWADYNPQTEQGRVWAARSTSDSDFAYGATGGEKKHTLTIPEMPNHNHDSEQDTSGDDSNSDVYGRAVNTSWNEVLYNRLNVVRIKNKGGDQPHNNLQPYVAVRYIKYVGL